MNDPWLISSEMEKRRCYVLGSVDARLMIRVQIFINDERPFLFKRNLLKREKTKRLDRSPYQSSVIRFRLSLFTQKERENTEAGKHRCCRSER